MKYLPWAVCCLLFGAAFYLTSQALNRASVAEGRVQVLDSLRVVAETKARADSLALEAARTTFRADSSRLASERAQALRRASEASRVGQEAADALRASLDVQEGILLDSLEAAHASEVRALEEQIALADSATVVVRSLLAETERALQSERLSRQAAVAQIGGLEDQIRNLNRAKRWSNIRNAGIVAAAVVVVLAGR